MFKKFFSAILVGFLASNALLFSASDPQTDLFRVMGKGADRNTAQFYIDSSGNAAVAGTLAATGAVTLSSTLSATTLDTGQGANELYDMDQNVMTSSTVTFASMTVTNQVNSASFKIGANDLTTSEWAYLDGQNQSVKTTSAVVFASATLNGIVLIPLLDVTVSSPSANVGQIVRTAAGVLYMSTDTAAVLGSWAKVGGQ